MRQPYILSGDFSHPLTVRYRVGCAWWQDVHHADTQAYRDSLYSMNILSAKGFSTAHHWPSPLLSQTNPPCSFQNTLAKWRKGNIPFGQKKGGMAKKLGSNKSAKTHGKKVLKSQQISLTSFTQESYQHTHSLHSKIKKRLVSGHKRKDILFPQNRNKLKSVSKQTKWNSSRKMCQKDQSSALSPVLFI